MTYSPIKIGIIGAGFSGSALAAALVKSLAKPLELFLFEKSGEFGSGPAYRTPYKHHLLNVQAKDMSAFEKEPDHFLKWLQQTTKWHHLLNHNIPFSEQFVPRLVYHHYLKYLLETIQAKDIHTFHLVSQEVINIQKNNTSYDLILKNQNKILVDKIILACGNAEPKNFSFPVSDEINILKNPWDYQSIERIPKEAPVVIVGTGLSMIDAVLSLYNQKHMGPIYAVSRHGLLPVPRKASDKELDLIPFPGSAKQIMRHVRKLSKEYPWQDVIHAFRKNFLTVWQQANLSEQKKFLRHGVAYWNIHRHRVPIQIAELLQNLMDQNQLKIIAGRIQSIEHEYMNVLMRHSQSMKQFPVKYLINCLGPSHQMPIMDVIIQKKLGIMDPLRLGLAVSNTLNLLQADGIVSNDLFALGHLTKGTFWECTAVPDIRKQIATICEALV